MSDVRTRDTVCCVQQAEVPVAGVAGTYRTLGAWVAHHAEPSGERIREWYRAAPWGTEDVQRSAPKSPGQSKAER